MPGLNSRRSLLGLFALSALGCAFIFGASRLARTARTEAPSDLIWKLPRPVYRASFTPDGRSITMLASKNCDRFDAKTGRLLSSWALSKFGGALTPDGASVISLDFGNLGLPVRTQVTWSSTASKFSGAGETTRPHSRVQTVRLRSKRFLISTDARTGAVQWKVALPDDTPVEGHDFYDFPLISNRDIYLGDQIRHSAPLGFEGGLLRLSRQNGKRLESIRKTFRVRTYEDSNFAFTSDGTLWQGSRFSRQSYTGEWSHFLELKAKGAVRRFEMSPLSPSINFWIPLVFSVDGKFLSGMTSIGRSTFSRTDDVGNLYLWKSDGKLLWTTHVDNFTATAIAFSPDNRYVAVGGNDWNTGTNLTGGRLLVYEVANAALVKELTETTSLQRAQRSFTGIIHPNSSPKASAIPGYCAPVDSLTWSPDSKTLGATYGRSGFKLWRVRK